METTKNYSVTNHGIDYPDYFQGDGLAFSDYEHIATGIGDTAHAAYQDAIEQACMRDDNAPEFPDTDPDYPDTDAVSEMEEYQDADEMPTYFVTIKW